jgi:hypothetical protein
MTPAGGSRHPSPSAEERAVGPFGNTTSASAPLAPALNPDELRVGTRLGRIGFGGGLSANFAFGTIRHPLEARTNRA